MNPVWIFAAVVISFLLLRYAIDVEFRKLNSRLDEIEKRLRITDDDDDDGIRHRD